MLCLGIAEMCMQMRVANNTLRVDESVKCVDTIADSASPDLL